MVERYRVKCVGMLFVRGENKFSDVKGELVEETRPIRNSERGESET